MTLFLKKTFENLKSKKGRNLRFDFYLPKQKICIEFQGQQHYSPVELFGGEDALEALQDNDQTKRDWCRDNGYKLIEIKYINLNKIEKILNKLLCEIEEE